MFNEKLEIGAVTNNEDFREFSQVLKRVEETNVFSYALQEGKFEKVNDYLFRKNGDQLIKIFHENGKWQYSNLRNSKDRGSLVQFIANRWSTGKVEANSTPATIFLAAKVANAYYQEYIKSLKSVHKEKPTLIGSTSQVRHRR